MTENYFQPDPFAQPLRIESNINGLTKVISGTGLQPHDVNKPYIEEGRVFIWGEQPVTPQQQLLTGPYAAQIHAYQQQQQAQQWQEHTLLSQYEPPQTHEPPARTSRPVPKRVAPTTHPSVRGKVHATATTAIKLREATNRQGAEPSYFWHSFLCLLRALVWCVPCWCIVATMHADGVWNSVAGFVQALVGLWFITTWFIGLGGIIFFIAGICSLSKPGVE